MRFSEEYQIQDAASAEWFDPLLTEDTQLFVDPFLIFDDSSKEWSAAHSKLVAFFNDALKLLAKSGFKRGTRLSKVEQMLLFPEPQEFCLGYSEASTAGAGSSAGLRKEMIDGAREAITRGIGSVDHFEELAIFGGGIGADRISDIVCNVLKEEFIDYTQRVSGDLGVALTQCPVEHARWDGTNLRWINGATELPRNPYAGDKGVILTPKRFLKRLPTVEPGDFWAWAWENENETIRNDLNFELGRNAEAKEIAYFARRHPDLVGDYLQWRESEGGEPYDLETDPDLEVDWYEYGGEVARNVKSASKAKSDDFPPLVRSMVEAFKHWVEQEGGWQHLRREGSPRKRVREKQIQSLFRAIVIHYCRANDIDLSGESDAGRGPVDFKFSRGWRGRALVEVKPMDNPRYRHGIDKQLPTYLGAEEVFAGFFLAIGFTDGHMEPERIKSLRDIAKDASDRLNRKVELVTVDARPKPSASKA